MACGPISVNKLSDYEQIQRGSFYLMGNRLGMMRCLADILTKDARWPENGVRTLSDAAEKSSSACENVGLRLSAKALRRFASEISEKWSGDTLTARVDAIKHSIQDEFEDHLFLWVPSHRAVFFPDQLNPL